MQAHLGLEVEHPRPMGVKAAGADDARKDIGGAPFEVDGGVAGGVVEPVTRHDKRLLW